MTHASQFKKTWIWPSDMTTAHVKKWAEFQHYKNRCPPWIKLQKSILDDYDYACLPVASKALAPLLWLLASESMEGAVCIDPDWLAFRLRFPIEDVHAGLTPLIEKGFLIVASKALAKRKQTARPEGEGEAEKRERKTRASVGIEEWIKSLAGSDAIPADDPIFDYAEKTGIPVNFLELSWRTFREAMAEAKTEQKDWRAHYRNAVRRNWYKIWWFDKVTGECQLTTVGEQAKRAAA